MCRYIQSVALLLSGVLTTNGWLVAWSPTSRSVEPRQKQTVNFYGIIRTCSGNEWKVDNIMVNRAFERIPVYEMPALPVPAEQVAKQADETSEEKSSTKQDKLVRIEIPLAYNPATESAITYLDLKEIRQLHVADHRNVWIYTKKGHKQEHLELVVTPKDEADAPRSYLASTRMIITCDGISKSGPEEKKIPLQALDTLEIRGYCIRDAETGKCTSMPGLDGEPEPVRRGTRRARSSARRS